MNTIYVRLMDSYRPVAIAVDENAVKASFLKEVALSKWFKDSSVPNVLQEFLSEQVYLSRNGHLLDEEADTVEAEQYVNLHFRLCGGKGGFGSMLRAIGAQIEKTTNREACRDLSGRRLRDINEEMRLKKWIAKQAEREQEKETRKKERLERRLATPKHTFTDTNYDKKRSEIPERINQALAQGLALEQSSGSKRSSTEPKGTAKKRKLWSRVGMDDMDDSSDSQTSEGESGPCVGESTSSSEDTTGFQDAVSTPCAEEQPCKSGSEQAGISQFGDCVNREDAPSTSTSSSDLVDSSSIAPVDSESATSSTPDPSPEEVPVKEEVPVTTLPDKLSDQVIRSEPNTIIQAPFSVNLDDYASARELESALSLDQLKAALSAKGMKCGGSLSERATRLFSVKGLADDQIDRSLLAKPLAKGKRQK